MPRAPSDVWIHFTSASVDGKTVHICKYCAKAYVKNATKMQRHIDKCLKFPTGLKQANSVTQPPRNKAKKDHSEFIRDKDALHIQDERQYEERLHREARAEQKEERANLMVMWKEMMEFQGNLLKEFLHHSSLPTSLPYQKHAHYNQASSSLPGTSTSYMAPYEPTGIETENESVISQEEEEKYIPSENPTILDVRTLNCTNDSQSNITPALSPPSTQATEKTDLETSVLRRQERVLQLQEEYYSLKIKYLKDKMTRDQVTEQ